MAANGAGRRARRIEQDVLRRLLRSPLDRVGDMRLAIETKTREIGIEALDAPRRAIERDDMRAGGGELRGLAARRRAEIEHRLLIDRSPKSFTGSAAAAS